MLESEAQQRLLDSINDINKFLKTQYIEVPHPCDWDNQNWYNYLHLKFEKLSGSWSSPTRLFAAAPTTFRNAVRSLNFYTHRLEARPYKRLKPWYISFDKDCYQRLPLNEADYELFEHVILPGQVVIHYAELGKTLIDLYCDGLPADYPGLKNLHFYSAEISICMSDYPISLLPAGFGQWAQSNGIDIFDKKLGIGGLSIGQVRDLDAARQTLYNGNTITQLRII
jgi:hypothetical protein